MPLVTGAQHSVRGCESGSARGRANSRVAHIASHFNAQNPSAPVDRRALLDHNRLSSASYHSARAGTASAHEGRILRAEDWDFWRREGYVVVPNAVPPEGLARVRAEMFTALGADEDDPDTWYQAVCYNKRGDTVPQFCTAMLLIRHCRCRLVQSKAQLSAVQQSRAVEQSILPSCTPSLC